MDRSEANSGQSDGVIAMRSDGMEKNVEKNNAIDSHTPLPRRVGGTLPS